MVAPPCIVVVDPEPPDDLVESDMMSVVIYLVLEGR